nr:MAG TPA: hypothetical protein [Caudoviricetes sp.]
MTKCRLLFSRYFISENSNIGNANLIKIFERVF